MFAIHARANRAPLSVANAFQNPTAARDLTWHGGSGRVLLPAPSPKKHAELSAPYCTYVVGEFQVAGAYHTQVQLGQNEHSIENWHGNCRGQFGAITAPQYPTLVQAVPERCSIPRLEQSTHTLKNPTRNHPCVRLANSTPKQTHNASTSMQTKMHHAKERNNILCLCRSPKHNSYLVFGHGRRHGSPDSHLRPWSTPWFTRLARAMLSQDAVRVKAAANANSDVSEILAGAHTHTKHVAPNAAD